MKKALLATAMGASVAAAPAWGSAEYDEVTHLIDTMPQLYGAVSLAYEHNHTRDDVTGGKDRLKDNESYIGVRHDHEIMPGLEAFVRAEWWFNANRDDDTFQNLEYAYAGVEGDFGRIWAGTDDTVYERQIDHIANFYQSEFRDSDLEEPRNSPGRFDTGRNNLVQYSSPMSDGGWQIHGALQYSGDGDDETLEEEGKASRAWQFATTYTTGNWEWAAAVDSNDGGSGPDNTNTYGFRGTWEGEQLGLTAQHQRRTGIHRNYGLLASYTIGPNQFAVSWERERDLEGDDERTYIYSAQVLHNMSEHFYLYVEGFQSESNKGTPHTRDFLVGATYHF